MNNWKDFNLSSFQLQKCWCPILYMICLSPWCEILCSGSACDQNFGFSESLDYMKSFSSKSAPLYGKQLATNKPKYVKLTSSTRFSFHEFRCQIDHHLDGGGFNELWYLLSPAHRVRLQIISDFQYYTSSKSHVNKAKFIAFSLSL